AVLALKMPETEFEGQTKTKLGNTEARAAVEAVVAPHITAWLEENPDVARALLEKASGAAQAREAARKVLRARDLAPMARERRAQLGHRLTLGTLACRSGRFGVLGVHLPPTASHDVQTDYAASGAQPVWRRSRRPAPAARASAGSRSAWTTYGAASAPATPDPLHRGRHAEQAHRVVPDAADAVHEARTRLRDEPPTRRASMRRAVIDHARPPFARAHR
ncbi:MAG TPA: hypothetical protein VLA98_14690, partial [Solirubrobacteraceae bacterium]|nr:hypothetical protein [Solirubrobacteraceae bacterium]